MSAAKMDSSSNPLQISSEDTHTLSDRINISTRSTHTQLNRLIVARLPLALPPHTDSPSVYAAGLLHVAPIYITFESLWQNLISPDLQTKECDEKTPSVHRTKIYPKTHSILTQLFFPELLRSERLKSDIQCLSGNSPQEIDEQLAQVCQSAPSLESFVKHMEASIPAKPHILVAYAWVLYMALFSGGRYLRASFQSAGSDFWFQSPSAQPESNNSEKKTIRKPPLQFFNFPGAEDGEDIKKEFKTRIIEVDNLLSEREKQDIVREAQHIFDFMVGIVSDLDDVCNTQLEQGMERRGAAAGVAGGSMSSAANPPLRSVSASGIFVIRSIVGFSLGTLWRYVLSPFMGRGFAGRRT